MRPCRLGFWKRERRNKGERERYNIEKREREREIIKEKRERERARAEDYCKIVILLLKRARYGIVVCSDILGTRRLRTFPQKGGHPEGYVKLHKCLMCTYGLATDISGDALRPTYANKNGMSKVTYYILPTQRPRI